MEFLPNGDYVLVRENKSQKKTSAGVFIPNDTSEQCVFAVVVSVGQGRESGHGFMARLNPLLQPGTTVVFQRSLAVGLKVEGDVLLLVREQDILAFSNDS